MQVIVTEVNEHGGFIARCQDRQYLVLRLDNNLGVAVGDVLEGPLKPDKKKPVAVANLTQGTTLRVSLANWSCPEFVAQIVLQYVRPTSDRHRIHAENFA